MELKLARKLLKELKALGIHDAHIEIGRRHPRLVGTVNGKPRFYVVPATASDWRSEANARSGMKRVFGIAREPAKNRPNLPAPSPAPRRKPRKAARVPTPSAPIAEAAIDRFYTPLAQLRARLDLSPAEVPPTPTSPPGRPQSDQEASPRTRIMLRVPFLGLRRQFTQEC